MVICYALAKKFHNIFRRFGDCTATFISEWLKQNTQTVLIRLVTGDDVTVMMECMNIITI